MKTDPLFKFFKFASGMNQQNKNENNSEKAERSIRQHVLFSMGAGLIPLPVADFLAVTAVQVDMIRSLCNVYGTDFQESQGKAIVSALTGSGLSRLGASALVKAIPGVGSVIGGASMAVLSGASTYAIGQVFKLHFETGGTILDFDTNRFKKYYDEQFEKGKKVAEDIKYEETQKKTEQEQTPPQNQQTPPQQTPPSAQGPQPQQQSADLDGDIVKKLKELAELKDMGVITPEEFVQMKARLLENFGKK
jgi:uncharacterized protein (DUF697 family)